MKITCKYIHKHDALVPHISNLSSHWNKSGSCSQLKKQRQVRWGKGKNKRTRHPFSNSSKSRQVVEVLSVEHTAEDPCSPPTHLILSLNGFILMHLPNLYSGIFTQKLYKITKYAIHSFKNRVVHVTLEDFFFLRFFF